MYFESCTLNVVVAMCLHRNIGHVCANCGNQTQSTTTLWEYCPAGQQNERVCLSSSGTDELDDSLPCAACRSRSLPYDTFGWCVPSPPQSRTWPVQTPITRPCHVSANGFSNNQTKHVRFAEPVEQQDPPADSSMNIARHERPQIPLQSAVSRRSTGFHTRELRR